MRHLTLGLDLGPNSIGWALVEEDEAGKPQSLEAVGVRIFQEMTTKENKIPVPKNQQRRKARLARRQLARRRMRRNTLQNALIRCGLLPENAEDREKLFRHTDPYEIRKRGLDHSLDPHELGRAIFHLNQRRGFLSNRKVRDSGEKKKEDGVVKQAIGELSREIKESESRTLGEFLAGIPNLDPDRRKRARYTERAMYKHEFDELWKKQAEFHPELLSDERRNSIREILFYQRPLRLQKFLVGKCTFECSKKRCPWGRPEAQWFRALEDVNNLRVRDPETGERRELTSEEREVLKKLLWEKETLKWSDVRDALGFHSGQKFNLEDQGKSLTGARTLVEIRKILQKTWDAMSTPGLESRRKLSRDQDAFLEDLFSIHKEETLLKRLEKCWKLSREQAEELWNNQFEEGYARLSLRAIRKINCYMERGLGYTYACEAAGYLREDQKKTSPKDLLPPAPDIRNPIVQKAINEVRKVVNAIVREYGKPSRIRVELARDMKRSKKHKVKQLRENEKNRVLNNEARKEIEKQGHLDNWRNRLIYRLWKEQKCQCPYTGDCIGKHQVFTAAVEVDHIIPRSQIPDDSYMNKVLCKASANQEKGNATPWQKWGESDPKRFSDILQRIKKLPHPKRDRFTQKELNLDGFIEQQLNDTRYISREVSGYLKKLGVKVEVTRGGVTHNLAHFLGLNAILADASVFNTSSVIEKNRADHRHHAVDALVVALTTPRLFRNLASFYGARDFDKRRSPLAPPWPGFTDEVREQLEAINVSYQPMRKISGALHKDFAYGRIYNEGKYRFVRRVPLTAIDKMSQVKRIVDRRIRELALKRIEAHGGSVKAALSEGLWLKNPQEGVEGRKIKKVRLDQNKTEKSLFGVKPIGEDKPFKYYERRNNHHIEIIENKKTGKWKGCIITTMEAAQRKHIVRRDHGEDWKFVMWLSINDMVKLNEPVNGCDLYRVQKISKGDIHLRAHTAAKIDDDATLVRIRSLENLKKLRGRKMSVDPLGKLEAAHD